MIFQVLYLIAAFSLVKQVSSLSCLDVKKTYEKSCLASEHDNYVECVRTRMKRHQQTCEQNDNCYACDCEFCSYSQCGGECDQCCNSCCTNYVQCHTNHCCHRQCHSECRTYDCRNACRKSCYATVEKEKQSDETINGRLIERVIQGGEGRVVNNVGQDSKVNNTNVHNITTIINLKNVLNNSNFLDVPINLTYTNRNNITLVEGGGAGGTADNCCIVIGPRQCVPIQISPYTRCFHTRSRQCGSYCSASIVHEESRQICNSVNSFGQPTNCQQQTAYVPQPQPRCTYTSSWPYVACGIQPPAACEGCYGHYFNNQVKQFKACSPQCFDDFSVGPLYRQGPFYQPSYSHVAPCAYSPLGCATGGLGGMAGGYGFGGGAMPSFAPAYGGYGQFPGGYNYGFGPGLGGFGYGVPMPDSPIGFPVQPFPWNSTSNATITSNNDTHVIEPRMLGGFEEDMLYIPLNQVPDKEVEIEVFIKAPNGTKASKPHKRTSKKNNKKEKEVSVVAL